MMMIGTILAAAEELTTDDKINQIYDKIMDLPEYAYYGAIWLLPVVIAVVCILLWQRQKKMAENQVRLARMMEELSDKLDKK